MRRIQFRSAPAQKAGPSAASTTARTSARLAASWKAAVISAITSSLKALRTSGRLSVSVSTAPFVGGLKCWSSWRYIRNTPNFVSGIGAFSAALRPSASTRRVSAGSITPSSHSRARGVVRVALVLVLAGGSAP